MIEEAVNFKNMTGILSSGSQNADAPVVLLFNAGFLHRVGPFRLWVDVARTLAETHVPSLRFDLAGLGDSPAPPDSDANDDPVVRTITNLRQAMDFVEGRLGKRDFLVFGLCSGADYAHPAAVADARIRGIVFIDGYGYRTPGYHFHRHFKRLTSLRRWINLTRRTVYREPAFFNDFTEDLREFPPRARIQTEILDFLRAGRRLHYVYSGGVPEYFNHARQFWEMFPLLQPSSGLRCTFFGKTDHTFALVRERAMLIGLLVEFAHGACASRR